MDESKWNLYLQHTIFKGCCPKRASKLRKLGINTIEDLLFYVPREYDDRFSLRPLGMYYRRKGQPEVEILGEGNVIRPRKPTILKIPIRITQQWLFSLV